MGKRFLVNETFATDDGEEYVGGGIYDIDEKNEALVERWLAEGKVRDPDAPVEEAEADEDEHEDDAEEGDKKDPA